MTADVTESLDGHVLLTSANGELRDPDAAARTLAGMAAADRVVLHFHGGLVSQKRGLATASSLKPVYERASVYPVFVVWRSGLLEIVTGNLSEIAQEDTFKRLLRRLVRYSVAKLSDVAGGRAAAPSLPTESAIAQQLGNPDDGREPFGALDPSRDVPQLSAAEVELLSLEIQTDAQLQATLQAAVNARRPAPEVVTSKGLAVGVVSSGESLLDPQALDEIAPTPSGVAAKGIVSMTLVATKAVRVLASVVGRFRAGTHHGVYVTVVEELLREFYLANAGALVWHAMKKETADTFVRQDPERGGVSLLDRLAERSSQGAMPRISLVGHSTGAVFINEFLGDVERRRAERRSALPANFRFEHVVFLAPACTFNHFEAVVDRHDQLFESFRMFTMTDRSECKDALVPLIYPRSLLYLVSGLLERSPDGASQPGIPLVGLARFFSADSGSDQKSRRKVRDFVLGSPDRVVWSPATGGPGLSSGATSHGEFDDDEGVRASLVALLSP
jgi:hypothetical protein